MFFGEIGRFFTNFSPFAEECFVCHLTLTYRSFKYKMPSHNESHGVMNQMRFEMFG